MTEQELQDHVKSGKSHSRLPGNSLAPYSMGARPVQWYPAPQIMCRDGFTVSVQAGEYSYCQPRNNDGPYTHLELGFPNMPDELIQVYAEDPDQPTDTVYPQVPLEVVLALIVKHGGLVEVIDL
jgi:hypothetical protein